METRFTNGSAEFDVHSGAEKSDKGTNDPNHKGKSGWVCVTNYCGLKYFIVKQGLMFVREEIWMITGATKMPDPMMFPITYLKKMQALRIIIISINLL